MYIQQSDLFQGMSRDFVKKVMDISTREIYREGELLFREGDPARYFYVLLKGHLRLTAKDSGQVYTVRRPGEAFGWSSLVGRENYSASAECLADTKLVRIDRDHLQKILEEDPVNGLIFFRRLARILGYRLTETYKMISAASRAGTSTSYGTGQVVETTANIQ